MISSVYEKLLVNSGTSLIQLADEKRPDRQHIVTAVTHQLQVGAAVPALHLY